MKDNQDIEDLFQKAFDEFEETPSSTVWNGISRDRESKQKMGLADQTAESFFSRIFQSFQAQPNASVWTGIKGYLVKKMWMRRIKWTFVFILFSTSLIYVYNRSNSTPSNEKFSEVKAKANLNIQNSPQSSTSNPIIQEEVKQASSQVNMNSATFSNDGVVMMKNTRTHKRIPAIVSASNHQSIDVNYLPEGVNTNSGEPREFMSVDPVSVNENMAKSDSSNIDSKVAENNENIMKPVLQEDKKDTKKADKKSTKTDKNKFVKYTKNTDINNEEADIKIGIMAGMDYGNFLLKGGNDIYKDVRKSQELFRPGSFHLGITFSRMLNAHWYIQANAVFANQSMNIAYNKKVVTKDTVRDGSGNITSINNKVLFQMDTTGHYAFSTLEIPLMIGYRSGYRRWSFHALAGPEWSLIIDKRGSMLSANNMQLEPISNTSALPTVKQLWGMWLAVGAGYQINHHYSLTVEPVLRYKFTSLFGSNYPAKQYNYATGINLGLRYHIH